MTERPRITDSPLRFFNYTLKVYSGAFAKYEHKDPEGAKDRDWLVSVAGESDFTGTYTWVASFISREVHLVAKTKESPAQALSALLSRLNWLSNIQYQVDEY